MHHLRTATVVGLVLLTTACGKKPVETIAPVEREPTRSEPAPRPDDSAARAAEEAARRAAEEARIRDATLAEPVFFDYDLATIRADQRSVLDAKARILRDNPGIRIRIEGHADERGTAEYNLALGQVRAEAIKDYLVGFGLDAGRFALVSYGEERPLVTGSSETSWARNRRGEFVVQSTGEGDGN